MYSEKLAYMYETFQTANDYEQVLKEINKTPKFKIAKKPRKATLPEKIFFGKPVEKFVSNNIIKPYTLGARPGNMVANIKTTLKSIGFGFKTQPKIRRMSANILKTSPMLALGAAGVFYLNKKRNQKDNIFKTASLAKRLARRVK